MVRMRLGIAVTLVTGLLPQGPRRAVARFADAVLLGFAVALLVLSWRWYDPIALVRAGFDLERFALETMKFIYTEPTNTIGIAKFWVWLAVPADGDAGAAAIRAALKPLSGHATLVRAPDAVRAAVPVFEPLSEPLMRVTAGIKKSFDPEGVFEPGRMYAGV